MSREPHRSWPPLARSDSPAKGKPELYAALLLLPASPLAMWAVMVAPGTHPWARLVWPLGWIVALLIVAISGFARG